MGFAALVVGQEEGEGLVGSYKIEGKVTPPDVKPANWLTVTTVTLDGGKRRAFLREDNSFVFQGVTSGTFLVEVENPDYLYEQVRVDINSKGKHRARKNNGPAKPSDPTPLSYQGETPRQVPLLPEEGGVEGDGRVVQPHGDDDGDAAPADHSPA